MSNLELKLLRISTQSDFATLKFNLFSNDIIFKSTVMFRKIFEKNLIHENEKKYEFRTKKRKTF